MRVGGGGRNGRDGRDSIDVRDGRDWTTGSDGSDGRDGIDGRAERQYEPFAGSQNRFRHTSNAGRWNAASNGVGAT